MMRMPQIFRCRVASIGLLCLAFFSAVQAGEDRHLGNATCGNSSCHEATQPWKVSAVTQNEYTQWKAHDPHAKAYAVLRGPLAKRIGEHLGIADVQKAGQCLDCHADNVPAAQRGPHFSLADGVGCESCHGGADRWLGVHVSGKAGHAENVAAGMVALEDPQVRAQVCTSCHVGTASKHVDHSLYASGHPRLNFELDTYTAAGANHYRVSDEYLKRKGRPDHAQTWAVGQAVAASLWLDGIADPVRFTAGIQPELAFFDCNSCHHAMSAPRWTPRPELDMRTGVPRLNDASLLMLQVLAARIAPDLAASLSQQRQALYAASLQGATQTSQAAAALRRTVGQLTTRLRQHDFRKVENIALLRALSEQPALDYVAAEQITLAASSLLAALDDGSLDAATHKAMQAVLDRLYREAATAEQYRPDAFRSALQQLRRAIPTRP